MTPAWATAELALRRSSNPGGIAGINQDCLRGFISLSALLTHLHARMSPCRSYALSNRTAIDVLRSTRQTHRVTSQIPTPTIERLDSLSIAATNCTGLPQGRQLYLSVDSQRRRSFTQTAILGYSVSLYLPSSTSLALSASVLLLTINIDRLTAARSALGETN